MRLLPLALLTVTAGPGTWVPPASGQSDPKVAEPKKEVLPTLAGWVLSAESGTPLPGATVTATFRDSPKILSAKTNEKGYYEFKDVPLNDVVNVMRFEFAGRGPGFEQKLSTSPSPGRPNNVNKSLSLPSDTFTFDALLGQFGAYTFFFHFDTGNGIPAAALTSKYGTLILGLPEADDETRLPGLTSTQRETIRKVRQQVLELYGLAASPGPGPNPGCPQPPQTQNKRCCLFRWCR